MAKILNELTDGLVDVSNGTVPTFDIGPLKDFGGQIEGILDKFGLDFGGLVADFKADYAAFKDNLDNQTSFELEDIINLKPKSLAKFGNLLQIGSKVPSPQLSFELKYQLWDKLVATFPSYQHNGVPVPGLALGQNFQSAFPVRGDFPVQYFLPALAVAYGKAPSFDDIRAKKFSTDSLFTPEFGPALSLHLLNKLKDAPSLGGIFSQFDSFDPISGLPMVSLTKELFDVTAYLPGMCRGVKNPIDFLIPGLTLIVFPLHRNPGGPTACSISGIGISWFWGEGHPGGAFSVLSAYFDVLCLIHQKGANL